jgi:hypothetical protein
MLVSSAVAMTGHPLRQLALKMSKHTSCGGGSLIRLDFPGCQLWLAISARLPATSVPFKEGFSAASDLITQKQNRMAPKTAEARMCARYWL